jgi:hypothetical protein
MANLRGGTFDKQLTNVFYRLEAFKKGRHFSNDNLTHSLALAKKREMYARDFKEYLEQKGITEGKINKMLTEENVKEFIEQRTMNLSPKSSLDYTTGFNSMLKGLEQANITIPSNPTENDFLKNYREKFKEEKKELQFEKGRYIQNLDQKLSNLRAKNYESYVVAKLQSKTGLRVREAMEVVKNFEKYYNEQNSTLNGVIGKGNHEYQAKEISNQLALEIQKIEKNISYATYNQDLKAVGIDKSHNFRVTYAKNSFENKLKQGVEKKEALKQVSKEINHHRPSMTQYYLRRV